MIETVIQVKIGITINVDVSAKIRQKIICGKKDYIWNCSTCYKDGKYLESINDDSVILRDEIIKVTKAVPIKTITKKLLQKI